MIPWAAASQVGGLRSRGGSRPSLRGYPGGALWLTQDAARRSRRFAPAWSRRTSLVETPPSIHVFTTLLLSLSRRSASQWRLVRKATSSSVGSVVSLSTQGFA